MSDKLCPIMSAPVGTRYEDTGTSHEVVDCVCVGARCALWVSGAYTTEGMAVEGMCAYRLQAMTNADGKVVV